MTQAPLVTLLTVPTSFEAESIVAVLRDEAIDAVAGSVSARRAPGAGVPGQSTVRVRANDLDDARRILAARRTAAADLDWDDVDVGDRADDLPLHRPRRMPLAARIAFVVTALVAILGLAAGLVVLLGP